VNLEVALERTAPTRARWDAWTQREPALVDLACHDLRSELRAASQARQDELLGALVRLVRADRRAFGVLAACLLPGLRHRMVRLAPSLDRHEALAVMVGALYEAVVRCDTAQHDLYVAENLLALPTRRLRRAVVAHQAWSGHAQHSGDVAPHERGPELSPGALLASAVDARVLTEQEARLIFDTRIADRTLPEVARRIGLHYEAAKKRRQRAEAAWVAWWAPDACRRREQA
jgi:hypothetical protein